MKKTIKISRSASGNGTTVTVTILEDGVTASYSLKTTATAIGASVRAATNSALDMLRQTREEIDRAATEEAA